MTIPTSYNTVNQLLFTATLYCNLKNTLDPTSYFRDQGTDLLNINISQTFEDLIKISNTRVKIGLQYLLNTITWNTFQHYISQVPSLSINALLFTSTISSIRYHVYELVYLYWSFIQVLPGQNKGQRLQYYPPPPPILAASSSVGHLPGPLLHVPKLECC